MCNMRRIGGLIASTGAALLVAVGVFAIAAVVAGALHGAFSNVPIMIAMAIAFGVGVGLVNAAIAAVGPCRTGPCAAPADRVRGALVGLATALVILLAGTIVRAFGASIPYAGTMVAIALTIGGVGACLAFGFIVASLGSLDTCAAPAAQTESIRLATITSVFAAAAAATFFGGAGVAVLIGFVVG